MRKILEFIKSHKLTTIMILAAAVLAGYFVFRELLPSQDSTGVSYELSKVEKGEIETAVSATGQVGDVDQTDISSSVSGEVTKVAVEEGQEVKTGDLIAQVDTSDLDDEIYQAQLAVRSAELTLEKLKEPADEYDIKKAENELQAAKNALIELKLVQRNELAAAREEKAQAEYNLENLDEDFPDYETQKATYQSQISAADRKIGEYNLNHPLAIAEAEAKIKEAEKALEKAKEGTDQTDIRLQEITVKDKRSNFASLMSQKEDYTISAPKDGIIASLDITVGEKISSGGGSSTSTAASNTTSASSTSDTNALATLISKNKNTVVAVNEVDVPTIKEGQKVNLTFDAIEDLEITGTVSNIDLIGTEDQGVVYNNVTINFDTQDERINNGMTCNADIITNHKEDILLIPSSALKSQTNGDYVELALDQDINIGRNSFAQDIDTKLVEIEAGITDDVNVEVVSGLEEGDVIILSSTNMADSQDSDSEDSDGERNGSLLPFGQGGGPGGEGPNGGRD